MAHSQCTEAARPPGPQCGCPSETPLSTNTRETSPSSSPSYHSHQGSQRLHTSQSANGRSVGSCRGKSRARVCVLCVGTASCSAPAQHSAGSKAPAQGRVEEEHCQLCPSTGGGGGEFQPRGHLQRKGLQNQTATPALEPGEIGYSSILKCSSASGMWGRAALPGISSSQEGVDAPSSVSCPKPFHPVQEILAPLA